MPFTLSHPAVVLPLSGRGPGSWVLALPPLVAGSMAPDLPYYTPVPGTLRAWTHSFGGAFTIDVVLAVLLLAVGTFVARPVAGLLAPRWRPLVAGWTAYAWPRRPWLRGFALWYAALALGALTHVAWDSFTHPDGQVVTRVPALSDVVAGHPLYQLLQWGSSILGAVVVLVALRRASGRLDAGATRSRGPGTGRRRLELVALVVAVCALAGVATRTVTGGGWSTYNLATGFLAGAALGLLVYAAAIRLRLVGPAPDA